MTTGTFTKVYNQQPTEVQRQAIKDAFYSLTCGLMLMGKDVTVYTESASSLNGDPRALVVTLVAQGIQEDRLIGVRGGIKTLR